MLGIIFGVVVESVNVLLRVNIFCLISFLSKRGVRVSTTFSENVRSLIMKNWVVPNSLPDL